MVLQRLVDSGNTVIIIEHNIDVIKTADYVIDLGLKGAIWEEFDSQRPASKWRPRRAAIPGNI